MSSRQTSAQGTKNKPAGTKALFLRAADELLRETVAVTAREKVFPKRTRWQFAYELMAIANRYHTLVMYANGIEVQDHALFAKRYRAQTMGLAWLYALNAKMTAAQLCMGIDADLLAYWARLYVEARTRTQNWRASDRRRYEKRFGSLTAEESREPTIPYETGESLPLP